MAGSENPVLGQVVFGVAPMIDRQRAVAATRLTVFALRADAPPDAAALFAVLAQTWPEGSAQRVLLNLANEALLRDALRLVPPAQVMLEVPAFLAADPELEWALRALHARGNVLALSGRAPQPLGATVLGCFRHLIVEPDPAQPAEAAPRGLSPVHAGVTAISGVDAAFQRGATAVIGWPTAEPLTQGRSKAAAPDLKVIVELMRRVDKMESIDRLEAVLKNDPTLAFRLVRYINSAAFGLRVEINSFRHAIMMLGYEKLKRWLALLLASAGSDPNLKPVLFGAVTRGLFMEELVRASGDEQRRGEIFICGVFSLLDCLLAQPLEQLMQSIPVPQHVADALVHGSGPFRPYLELAQAVEQASVYELREASERLLLSTAQINRALLHALGAAQQLD